MSYSGALDDTEPKDLGLDQFETFRPIQREALEQAIYSDERFQGLACPTGSGKSLVTAAIAQLTGWRTIVLTATKGLQAQYERDFGELMFAIQGRNNYRCAELAESHPNDQYNCDDGRVMGCSLVKGRGCTYEQRRDIARHESLVQTNYAFWFHINRFPPGLCRPEKDGEPNPFDCLVLDEAHDSVERLADYLNVSLSEKEIRDHIGVETRDFCGVDSTEFWRAFAATYREKVESEYESQVADLFAKRRKVGYRDIQRVKQLEALVEKLKTLSEMDSEDWLCDYKEGTRIGRVWEFDAVWPGRYSEHYLFRGIPKVILMSATLRPKTMALLGIPKQHYKFTEWPKIFPSSRCPIYYLPPRKSDGSVVRVDRNITPEDLKRWVDHIDAIIEARQDRKGLICTVSYERQRYLMEHSKFNHMMIGNTGDPESPTAMEMFTRHVESRKPTILVSPSFATGWDFAYEAAEFVIICKIAFPDGRSKIMQARKKMDEDYPNYLAMLNLVQACGRGMRAMDDQCEIFLTDGHWVWFGRKAGMFAPLGFANSVRQVAQGLPKPLPKLNGNGNRNV